MGPQRSPVTVRPESSLITLNIGPGGPYRRYGYRTRGPGSSKNAWQGPRLYYWLNNRVSNHIFIYNIIILIQTYYIILKYKFKYCLFIYISIKQNNKFIDLSLNYINIRPTIPSDLYLEYKLIQS